MRTAGRVKLSGGVSSNSRQTSSQFDNLAGFGQVGRCRAAAAVRSEAEDEGPQAPKHSAVAALNAEGGPEGARRVAPVNPPGRAIQI
jgi:hypothetical protein